LVQQTLLRVLLAAEEDQVLQRVRTPRVVMGRHLRRHANENVAHGSWYVSAAAMVKNEGEERELVHAACLHENKAPERVLCRGLLQRT
jgi:hypothetical protein